jgi:hypothetical protein
MSFEIIPKDFIVYKTTTGSSRTTGSTGSFKRMGRFALKRTSSEDVPYKLLKSIKVVKTHNRVSIPSEYLRRYTGIIKRARHQIVRDLFVEFTKKTTRLLHPRLYLAGGMAVRLFLRSRNAKISKITDDTEDFDFHYVYSGNIEKDTKTMLSILRQHTNWFSKYLNLKHGFKSRIFMKELKGVPTDKNGQGYKFRKVYKVYRFILETPSKNTDLIDIALIDETKPKMMKLYGMNVQRYRGIYRDVAYTLAASFLEPRSFLRNPLIGSKKKKGLKDISRILNLAKYRGIKNPKVTTFIRHILNKNVVKGTRAAILLKRQLNRSHHFHGSHPSPR